MSLADPRRRDAGEPYCFLSGTLTGNPISATAGLATLRLLKEPGTYDRLRARTHQLSDGIRQMGQRKGIQLLVGECCSMIQVYFTEQNTLSNARDVLKTDKKMAVKFGRKLIENGVLTTPGGKMYLSTGHSEEDIEETLSVIGMTLDEII
ncbi:hypothetical protein OEG84_19425 [Hoeflea sp. G2-23]|uniref:Glutamate-1-semialdehyde 2,1-aminomutase n=1 Tax=Hoeflea algicola TaxID=2983763 RepID=A0ABT3ZDF4_9HYPH|nr:hypothetical protein [Hoeflea algicola]MCY0149818.1 hypothetical protein [Hoeflea algicola]